MAVERTYEKRGDIMHLRVVEKRTDILGTEFTLTDQEVEFDHEKHLPQLANKLIELQAEIADLQTEETRLVEQITAIEAARDTKDTRVT